MVPGRQSPNLSDHCPRYRIGFIASYTLLFSNRMENIHIYFLLFIVWLISLVENHSYFLAMRTGSEG